MGSWQPLPEAYPAEVVHFIEQLRLLKDRTGMSLVALGARTAYSKSSWQRYLNGQQPPPRKAVLALCRVAGLDAAEAARFQARWELAMRAWPRPDAVRPRLADAVRSDGARPDAVRGDAGAASALGERDDYDSDDPDTLPWWIPLDEPGPERAPSWRVLMYGAAAALVILLAALLALLT